jgi:predicted nucleotidyltransferase
MFKIMNLITPTSLRLLQTILGDPMGRYHGREVVRRTGVSAGGSNQMLRSFANLGLLLKEKQGRMLFYRANMNNAVVKQLKILFTLFQLDNLIKQTEQFSDRIILFGSSAEGTDVKDSDIDLLLLTYEKSQLTDVVHKFNAKSRRRIAPIILDPHGFSKLRREDTALFDRISRGIILWQKD